MKDRDETPEGIDRKLAAHYYARWKFTRDLLPSLQRAKDAGQEAKVVSVFGAGKGTAIDTDDLGLKKGFSVAAAGGAAPTYNDLMVEVSIPKSSNPNSYHPLRNPSIPFIHAYPGLVRTAYVSRFDSAFLRAASKSVLGLLYPFTVSGEECAEYMWHGVFSTSETKGSAGVQGAWRIGSRGEDLGTKRYFGDDGQRKKLWEHTWESVNVD